jgi:two-component system cell cycle sensor histidine kinase/response regulator CckA
MGCGNGACTQGALKLELLLALNKTARVPILRAMTESARGEVVLVVEDEHVVRSAVSRILRLQGYHVLEAEDGEHALRVTHAYRAPVQLLITDVVMPQMEGRELVALLRSWFPQMRVLFMSGYKPEYLNIEPDEEDGRAFLAKPFTFESLTKEVRQVLDREWNPA